MYDATMCVAFNFNFRELYRLCASTDNIGSHNGGNFDVDCIIRQDGC